jgi:ferrous iron transport protein B
VSVTVALCGQPNCGKSTLFNALAGFKANTGNFPGTTVEYTASEVVVGDHVARVIDLPGTYSFSPQDAAERVTREYLLSGKADVIVAVLDASVLARSLEMLLQVLEMRIPTVVALNMMDEAERKGVVVDVPALERRLGVPVIPTLATRGLGVVQVAERAVEMAARVPAPQEIRYDRDIETAVRELTLGMPAGLAESLRAPARFVALRLLEGDTAFESAAREADPGFLELATRRRRELAEEHDLPEDAFLASRRHGLAQLLFDEVARVVPRRPRSWRDSLDQALMHRVYGLAIAALVFALLFLLTFVVGDRLASLTGKPFDALALLLRPLAEGSFGWALVKGLADGLAGGVGIVLPYLLPLLFAMVLMEDAGYLPRAAFLVDGILHRIGLHGKSIIPFILGYGCNVPALMGTRILENQRDRVLTALLVPLIPCSARTVLILALVAAFLGPLYALGIYLLNLAVVAVVGRILSAAVPGPSLGLLMDVPPFRVPVPRLVLQKVWFRIRQFVVGAWPILIVASVVLGAIEYAGISAHLNAALSPLTVSLLGLPEAVGVTLFFGLLRKELSLLMLFQALGTENVAAVMTPAQILGFTLFVTFYVPCVSTIATLVREIGWKWTGVSVALNTGIAVVAAGLVHLVAG